MATSSRSTVRACWGPWRSSAEVIMATSAPASRTLAASRPVWTPVVAASEAYTWPYRIAILYGQVYASLAATTGVHTGLDAAKVLLAGADVAMITSALLRHGPQHARTVERELVAILQEHGYASVAELRGSMSRRSMPDLAGFERANYVRTLASWSSRYTVSPGQAVTLIDSRP